MYSSPLPIDVNGDGFLDVVMLCSDGYVRAFDGSNDYWQEQIGWQGAKYTFGSAAAADIDFDGDLKIAIGGQDRQFLLHAFELDGAWTPGWEDGIQLEESREDARNAPALCDANADGTVDVNFVDFSCAWCMLDGVGNLVQLGYTGTESTPVLSSPAVGDLGPPKPRLGGFGPGPPPRAHRFRAGCRGGVVVHDVR